VIDEKGNVDFANFEKTLNTRVSYPIYHIDNIVRPVSKGRHPSKVIFLACDSFGVLPPVAKLTPEQAMYQYLTGYTAKVAGTELGIDKPVATFSSCFGAPFLLLHPTRYADVLGEKMTQHGSKAYLVNTGWTGGAYGTGHRMSIEDTRAIITAILNDSIEEAECEIMPVFGFEIPKAVRGVDSSVLNPRNTWNDKDAYDKALRELAEMFVQNFKTFTDTENGKKLEKVGPKL